MNITLLFVVGHLASAMGYQYTGMEEFLLLSSALIVYSLYQFVKVCSLVFSPNWEVELSYAEHIPLQWKFLHNATIALSTYLIYTAGYTFVAGVISLYIFTVIASLLVTGLDPNIEDEEDEE